MDIHLIYDINVLIIFNRIVPTSNAVNAKSQLKDRHNHNEVIIFVLNLEPDMTASDFLPKTYQDYPDKGKIKWESPSNIALVKYWGKEDVQIPKNPSISFTLSECKTITELKFEHQSEQLDSWSFDISFDGKPKPEFRGKIETFFDRIEAYLPFLKNYHFLIDTKNTFPHSSGIASSASSMSALAACLVSLERNLDRTMSDADFIRKTSFLSRLGSGSACRSLEGELVVWGKHDAIAGSSDLYGVKFDESVNEVFRDYQDTILLVDQGQKQVSSTLGHKLMHGHPFARQRFDQANKHMYEIRNHLMNGDLDGFIHVVESEALSLHAMMMTSDPYFILMKPNTLSIIEKIWDFRKDSGLPVCFTLDAGANVHVLYPKKDSDKIYEFIKSELVAFCENSAYICDSTGLGAKPLQT